MPVRASSQQQKLTRAELRDIALRRRGDPDVYALLWEIKRLHGVLVRASELTWPIHQALPDLTSRETVLRRLTDLLEAEPAIDDPTPSRPGKPERVPATGHAEQRAKMIREEANLSDRDAKRQARARR